MREGTILFFERKDLLNHSKDVAIENIKITDFKGEIEKSVLRICASADFILFTDNDGRELVLKNRTGKDNIIF